MNAETHSFPAMFNTWGSKLIERGQKQKVTFSDNFFFKTDTGTFFNTKNFQNWYRCHQKKEKFRNREVSKPKCHTLGRKLCVGWCFVIQLIKLYLISNVGIELLGQLKNQWLRFSIRSYYHGYLASRIMTAYKDYKIPDILYKNDCACSR